MVLNFFSHSLPLVLLSSSLSLLSLDFFTPLSSMTFLFLLPLPPVWLQASRSCPPLLLGRQGQFFPSRWSHSLDLGSDKTIMVAFFGMPRFLVEAFLSILWTFGVLKSL